ncbi:MAG: conserved membrane protein of unknown function [Promethearchaeota archaeon]|nr:MAG: conserved membrane protein of unknown function [Candidatus Lokiarchaeota archaeon]
MSIFLFFWSVLGLIIGILYFIFSNDIPWKRNGLIMAFYIGFISLLIHFYKGFSPLNLAIWFGIGFVFIYSLCLGIFWISERKFTFLYEKVMNQLEKFTYMKLNNKRVLKTILIITPIIMWYSVNVDINVMVDNNTRLLWINVPSNIKSGEDFTITVEAWDAFERVSATYKGTVQFSLESYALESFALISTPSALLPEPYTFSGQLFGNDMAYNIDNEKDNGLKTFIGRIDTPGIHYILGHDSLTQNTYYSNPIIVGEYGLDKGNIYWGDLHTHTILSDGSGSPEHNYYYGRNVA